MSLIVPMDAGPITNPESSPENEACKNWLAGLAYNRGGVGVPEVADYEVRRELLRAGKRQRTRPTGRVEGYARICADHDAGNAEGRRVPGSDRYHDRSSFGVVCVRSNVARNQFSFESRPTNS